MLAGHVARLWHDAALPAIECHIGAGRVTEHWS
jgi:hypothetical protein